jgi:polyisoprenoid-binding protein YceI
MTTDIDTPDPDPAPDGDDGPAFPRWLKWGLLGALAVLVLGYGAIFLYTEVLNDAPDELGESDLDAALAVGDGTGESNGDPDPVESTATTQPPATDAPSDTEPPAGTEPADTEAAEEASAAETWVVTDASELGYRVKEILFGVDAEGVGRTNQITGSLTIDGTTLVSAEFVVDVASIESDDSRRDSQFRGRIMSTDEFPEATFVLSEPIELGTEPVDGATVETEATGDLTLRGVTNEVTFELTGRVENGRIGVLGEIPVVFEEYGIANPSIGGITTEDDGLLEFVLVFEPA